MDIFKLFFNHDQRLDTLAKRNANKTTEEVEAGLQDFMTPTPTFSKFYLTGTRLQDEEFGINRLKKYDQIARVLDKIFDKYTIYESARKYKKISNCIEKADVGKAILLSTEKDVDADLESLEVGSESNVGHLKDELREVLLGGHKVLYKEQAHDGYDLHLFSKENVYPQLFYPLQELVDEHFRFFSINSKRMRSEKHFYFETWTLDRPPHGAEEVFKETVL